MLQTGGGNLDKAVKVLRAFIPQVITDTLTGVVIDTQGFNELRCDIQTGAMTGTSLTLDGKLQHGLLADGSDMADIVGATFPQLDENDDNTDAFGAIRVFGLKRYVRYVGTVGGSSESIAISGAFILGSPIVLPVSGHASAAFDFLPPVPA